MPTFIDHSSQLFHQMIIFQIILVLKKQFYSICGSCGKRLCLNRILAIIFIIFQLKSENGSVERLYMSKCLHQKDEILTVNHINLLLEVSFGYFQC